MSSIQGLFQYPGSVSVSGWTCGTCGAWCAFGEQHHCYASPEDRDADALGRIASALERIALQVESTTKTDNDQTH